MYQEQIAKGMIYLDREMPNWEHRINLETLDLRDSRLCVIGQLTPDYYLYMAEASLSFSDVIELGFNCSLSETICSDEITHVYAVLTDEWRQAIAERREQHGSRTE